MKLYLKILKYRIESTECELAKCEAKYTEIRSWQERADILMYVFELSEIQGTIEMLKTHLKHLNDRWDDELLAQADKYEGPY